MDIEKNMAQVAKASTCRLFAAIQPNMNALIAFKENPKKLSGRLYLSFNKI
tara:strand:- start:135 stop:287 length:153 start_codon:yes stop_codon:yes gene_type:complete